ncbi:MAG: NAD-binding protein [Thermodesulfobacteriota bacterium]|nr:NAD-binding protein [Thermodesulfobacteriota bacterium]
MVINRIALSLLICLAIMVIGTTGYVLLENYPVVDAVYMAVITITTVGFGEIRPLSPAGRIFTTVLILVGFSSLAYAGHAAAELLLEKVWSGTSESKKMKKQISGLTKHCIICGFGRVGQATAARFKDLHYPFVIIEKSPEVCQQVKDSGYLFVEGDATCGETLLSVGIKKANGLLALLDSDPFNLFTVLTARELNPILRIISRCADSSSEKKILRAGADTVISPYATAGKYFAEDILSATGHGKGLDSGMNYCVLPQWVAIQEGSSMQGKTIALVSSEMGREIIGLRRQERDTIHPDPSEVLVAEDMILVLDTGQEDALPQKQASPRKIVIIDDNPVIVRLYARLFQKAGFVPLVAANGREGLDLLIKEKPEAAIVDFMLPVFSGIEVCRRVREQLGDYPMKLILFTADEKAETRKQALAAGADEVIIKSADASEVIDTVVHLLRPEV